MSRFVPAGAGEVSEVSPSSNDDAWAKARETIDTARSSKPVEPGKQEDGRSLYEVLQANKAAKQEAFEEATKLRNQFRPLDDSEIEFLDSVRDTERKNEVAAKQETAAQLDAFRKQRALAEQQARERELQARSQDASTNSGPDHPKEAQNSWTASKKRRRVLEAAEDRPVSKLKKEVAVDPPSEKIVNVTAATTQGDGVSKGPTSSDIATQQSSDLQGNSAVDKVSMMAGLVAYSSDEDD